MILDSHKRFRLSGKALVLLLISLAFTHGDLPRPLEKHSKAWLATEFMHHKHPGLPIPPKTYPFITFAVKTGSPVFSITTGEVQEVGYSKGYGHNVIVQNNDSLRVRYFHLSEILVDSCQIIKQGQKIANTGISGYVAAPTLGIKASASSVNIDPCQLMDCETYRRKPTK